MGLPQWFCHNGLILTGAALLLFFVLVGFKEPMFGNVDGSNTNVLPRKNAHGTGV